MGLGIRVQYPNGQTDYVQVSGKDYKIVQHEQAFRPLIDALTISGVQNFKFSLNSSFQKAELRVFTVGEGYDSVQIGFNVVNSFHGHETLNYGITMDRTKQYIELVGYRQVCSNGMVIRVPLSNAQFVKPELRREIETLLSHQWQFKHTETVLDRADVIKYVVEAMALLREPVEQMIKKAQGTRFDMDVVKDLIKQHVGNRQAKKVLEQYGHENRTYGVYTTP
ncbi:hypothetical protein GAMM_190003 [Gammaproteobacteria bacterium]